MSSSPLWWTLPVHCFTKADLEDLLRRLGDKENLAKAA